MKEKGQAKSENSLERSVREQGEEPPILGTVFALLVRFKGYHSIWYIGNTELLHFRCCKRLSALAAWQFTGVRKWESRNFVACADGQDQFGKE